MIIFLHFIHIDYAAIDFHSFRGAALPRQAFRLPLSLSAVLSSGVFLPHRLRFQTHQFFARNTENRFHFY